LALFSWKKKVSDDASAGSGAGMSPPSSAGGAGNGDGFHRDERKARAWFKQAASVADTRSWDYAIECYLSGLKHDPDNMVQHEALYEVAKRRKVAKGKPASLTERFKSSGRDPLSKFMDAEKLWAKDPLNPSAMLAVMKRAVDVHRAIDELDMAEFTHWVGAMLLEANAAQKSPSKTTYVEARDLFVSVNDYDKAVEACKMALSLDESDEMLLRNLRDLEAERTIKDANYGASYTDSVRDIDKQRELDTEDQRATSGSALDQLAVRYRADYEENPEDIDRLNKLVGVLEKKEEDDAQQEAIKLLGEAWERTGQYRFQVRSSDIRIKMYNRHLRVLKQQADKEPNNAELREKYNALLTEARNFELNEYTQRVKNYPTDMRLRFELGKRLLAFKKYDEAIGSFQEAQNDPKNRAASLNYLGVCYMAKGWHDEAVDSFRRGIETHQISDDKLAMELRYHLMDALEQAARRDKAYERAKEAREIASQLLQININYRDIRQRADSLRKLMDELQK
jgi:hypothetical protein